MNRSTSLTSRVFPRLLTAFAFVALGVVGAGCGKKKNAAAPVQPYPQYSPNPGYYPMPGVSPIPGMPIGPVVYPHQNQYCANSFSAPQGQAIPAHQLSQLLVDGEGGCFRLVDIQQFVETTQNGMVVNSSATDTSVSYDLVRVGRKRRARVATKASVRTQNVCGNAGQAGVAGSISLPLWIDRDTGAIGQNLRLQGAQRSSIGENGSHYDLDSFVRASSGYGVQGMQAYRTANGDLVLMISRTESTGDMYAYSRTLTRAVYRADY